MTTRLALLLIALLTLGFYFTPAYRANPIYVRSTLMLTIIHQIDDASLIKWVKVERAGAPDISTVTAQAATSKTDFTNGFLTRESAKYSFKLVAKSLCLELEPNCLQIQKENILKAVSVKVLM
ncbi:MAG: hypothetical protein ACLQKK_17725 [Rhodomicrobium sp.]